MKKIIPFVLLSLCVACNQAKSPEVKLETDQQKISYVIGQQIGSSLKRQFDEIDTAVLAASIQEAIDGKESRLTQEEMMQVMRQAREGQVEAAKREAEVNKKAGDDFLAANAKKEGIKTTDSGLQYQVLTEGKGKPPAAASKVKVHYQGTLIDGTEFDSSYKRNEPAEFPVNGVIQGWTEALQLMKPGAKWKLFIPSQLAYGERGRPSIPPNSVLIFEVELLEVL